ncbi:MAG: autotransporter domain-containing protein, partial [Alphaproteobacteria bacterium]|nr:autotransporter domain-containing protein [Alphaproteobacteria bacterium]
DIDYANSATVNITGDSIKILAPTDIDSNGIGIVAMSRGIINVVGDTTISAEKAIVARGEAKVNINTSGEHTVKMLGDIDFDYHKPTSGTSIDAYIDVTLAGADSVWTGNTVVTYDVKPEAEKLVVSNAKLTMNDGAVWNATKITDNKADDNGRYYTALNDLVIDGGTVNIADTERGIFVDRIVANDATFNGGMLNVNETINITSGTTVFNSAVLGEAGVLNLAEGATLDIGTSTVDLAELNINGTLLASVLSDRSYGSLSGEIDGDGKVQLNVGSVGSYKIFDSQADITVTAGAAYDVSQEADGTVVITTKAVEDIAADTGLTTQTAGAVAGLATSNDETLQQISLAAQQVLNSGDVAAVEREMAKLNPTDQPVAQAAVTSVQNQVLSLVSSRMAGGVSVGRVGMPVGRMGRAGMPVGRMGRAGGDTVRKENGFWMQGLFNKSKLADEFNGYTRGFALGADLLIDNKWTIGGGLAINDSDVHADSADIDIDSKTVFMYGQYKPNNWFVNATATYGIAEYTENKNPFGIMSGAAYYVESYGAQAMVGYDFATGVTTEVGARYLHIAQDAYTDDLGIKVKATDTDFLTGVAGMKYAFAIENDWAIQLRPELRAAMTYDFISDEAVTTVDMPGAAAYQLQGENLSRLGGEFGIGLTALYRGMEVSLMYDLDLHKDYTSQTGMIKFRGRF